eukprot:1160079-Pelagomonas_calceolata.AAC.6
MKGQQQHGLETKQQPPYQQHILLRLRPAQVRQQPRAVAQHRGVRHMAFHALQEGEHHLFIQHRTLQLSAVRGNVAQRPDRLCRKAQYIKSAVLGDPHTAAECSLRRCCPAPRSPAQCSTEHQKCCAW